MEFQKHEFYGYRILSNLDIKFGEQTRLLRNLREKFRDKTFLMVNFSVPVSIELRKELRKYK